MDTQRLILFVIFSFSALFLWERWQAEHRPPPSVSSQSAPKSANDTPAPSTGTPPAAGAPNIPGGPPGAAPKTGEKVTINDFATKLAKIVAHRTDRTVFFSVDDGVPYGMLVTWMAVAHRAGATNVAIQLSGTIE